MIKFQVCDRVLTANTTITDIICMYFIKAQFAHSLYSPHLPKQTKPKKKLTFFFCTCSFSEAFEGLRLNIFFSGPCSLSGQKAERKRDDFNRWGFLSLPKFSDEKQREGRAALRYSQMKCRSLRGSHMATQKLKRQTLFLVLWVYTQACGFCFSALRCVCGQNWTDTHETACENVITTHLSTVIHSLFKYIFMFSDW